jgi:hypothetical protein
MWTLNINNFDFNENVLKLVMSQLKSAIFIDSFWISTRVSNFRHKQWKDDSWRISGNLVKFYYHCIWYYALYIGILEINKTVITCLEEVENHLD